jgi:hypothetical protein
MDVSLAQAKQLNYAFSPLISTNFQWLPMTEIKGLDDNIKYEAALDTYRKWDTEKRKSSTPARL